MNNYKLFLNRIFQNYVWPLFLVVLPFFPDIYDKLEGRSDFFIYSVEYTKNPVIEWNRQISSYLKELDVEQQHLDSTSNYLLKKIGKELYNSTPAILAGTGYKPMDSMQVTIANITGYDLKNIRVHFIGCSGFDSYKTFPDQYNDLVNNSISNKKDENITIKYESIPHPDSRKIHLGYVTFYGLDASKCKPTVDAASKSGESVSGKLVNDIDDFQNELAWSSYDRNNLFDNLFKLFTGLAFTYFYVMIRNLQRKLALK